MASKSVLEFCVVLRFLTLGALAASIVVLVTNQFTSHDGSKTSFKDVITYRFVLATACIGCFYTLIQIPFAVCYNYKEKRLIKNDCLSNLDFYGDKIIAFLLASGAGAGLAVTYELKKFAKEFFQAFGAIPGVGEEESKTLKFLDRAYIATGLLVLGFVCVAILSVFSPINRSTSTSKGFFG